MKKIREISSILLIVILIISSCTLTACNIKETDKIFNDLENAIEKEFSEKTEINDKDSKDNNNNKNENNKPEKNKYYYDVENVVLYIHYYGKLPKNYVTKNKARDKGWNGGSVEDFIDGAAIGGDKFGNREGILPKKSGRTYKECDIDTDGKDSRGAKRLVFSNDGLYFYTDDHYSSFIELKVEEGKVKWN